MGPNFIQVVEKVNSLINDSNIKFAFITGDWTHHAGVEELQTSFNIANGLKIPYFPIIGNHDIFNEYQEVRHPDGDRRFFQLFQNLFQFPPKNINLSHFVGNISILDPTIKEIEVHSYYQNYLIEYEEIVFICLDWCNRDHHKTGVGGASLHDFPGGTFEWFGSRLSELSQRINEIKQIIMVQHHPFNCFYRVSCGDKSFTETQMKEISKIILRNKIPLEKIWGDISGHLHIFQYFPYVFKDLGEHKYVEYQCAATKMLSSFSIIHFENYLPKKAVQYCLDCPKHHQITEVNF